MYNLSIFKLTCWEYIVFQGSHILRALWSFYRLGPQIKNLYLIFRKFSLVKVLIAPICFNPLLHGAHFVTDSSCLCLSDFFLFLICRNMLSQTPNNFYAEIFLPFDSIEHLSHHYICLWRCSWYQCRWGIGCNQRFI